MIFLNFFVAYMVQKYQNESAPIFYYAKSKKYCLKLLKIAVLQPPDWIQRKKNTLYFLDIRMIFHNFQGFIPTIIPLIEGLDKIKNVMNQQRKITQAFGEAFDQCEACGWWWPGL